MVVSNPSTPAFPSTIAHGGCDASSIRGRFYSWRLRAVNIENTELEFPTMLSPQIPTDAAINSSVQPSIRSYIYRPSRPMGYDQDTGNHAAAVAADSMPHCCEQSSLLCVSASGNQETAYRTAHELYASELKAPI